MDMESPDDRELVDRLRRCDIAAFDEIFERFRARLFSFLLRISRRRDVAEDLLQETWIRLATRAETLREGTNLQAWLFTVARNLYLSHRRSARTGTRWIKELLTRSSESLSNEKAYEAVALDETEMALERALERLPVHYREVLLLVAVEEMTCSQGAQVCSLDPRTFRKRLSRGRRMLASILDEEKWRNPRSAYSVSPKEEIPT